MRVTYPHMGYLTIPVRNLLSSLDINVIEAPPITRKTLEIGSRFSPEGACLPYKINLGNFLESLEQGADTVVTVCGAGKCRLGFYHAVHKIALNQQRPVQIYNINVDHLFTDLYRFLQAAAPQANKFTVLKNIIFAINMLKALDAINNAKNYYGARTNYPQRIIEIASDGAQQLAASQKFRETRHIRDKTICLIKAACGSSTFHPRKVCLIGEFYLLVEPRANHMIEDTLLQQGIEVKKFVNTGDWVFSHTLLEMLGLYNEEKAYLDQASPYLNYHVGGEGLRSVGTALWCARNGYDGIVHVYPFGCTPEVVAQYALKNIAADYNIPLLSLSIDEHASDLGILTRLEAFADCIKRK